MSHTRRPPRSYKPSIKYRCRPLEGPSRGHSEFDARDHTPPSSDPSRRNRQNSEAKSSEMLSTAGLISAVGQIWDSACRPAFLQHKKDLGYKDVYLIKESVLSGKSSSYAERQFVFPADLLTNGTSPEVSRSNFELLGVYKKISCFEPHGENRRLSFLRRLVQRSYGIPTESDKANRLASVEISSHLRHIYGWMIDVTQPGPEQQLNTVLIENKKISECCLTNDSLPTKICCLGNSASLANNHTNGSTCFRAETTNYTTSSSGRSKKATENSFIITSLSSDYLLEETLGKTNVPGGISTTTTSRLTKEYYLKHLALDANSYIASTYRGADSTNKPNELLMEDIFQAEAHSPIQNKQQFGLAKQQHAFSGALAGISVSLCLHPVDTMKTVIQSCHADQRSINHICRSIISDRGMSGLYRGITSNIASSAPISAVYTFTYESVKGALLPLLPKEYHSFAHCLGGGCASVATSFIFTPSERIKQQMQVGFHYQNCWSALVGIVKKGGLTSLYAGWGAVLCRNVPHSIIKFYTYESLKQLTSQLPGRNAQSSTVQTLICGGLAGSTAALFTTPFDVVKTRLQTQIPGSIHRYNGVFRTLVEIGRHEGLKGLYRGLVPRLVMYVSQGAIFFAAYESFKILFSMDISPTQETKTNQVTSTAQG